MTPDKSAIVTLKEVTSDTVRLITKLEVTEIQKQFVAPNAVSIAEAYFCKEAWFRAVYADEIPVGFVMLYLEQSKAEYHLWRFMTDHRFQGLGYGFKAMELVIDYVRTLPNAREFSLSYVPGEGDPSGFYAKLGFVDTDEWDEDERIMKLAL